MDSFSHALKINAAVSLSPANRNIRHNGTCESNKPSESSEPSSRALEELLQQVRVAVLVATSGCAVVDATIAN